MFNSKARVGIGRRTMLAGAGATLASPAVLAQGQTAGVALVIGNSKYHWEAPLPNVRRDVPDIAKRFQALGLQTELVQDAGRDAMQRAIDKFTAAAQGANLAAFYFAGHGASWAKDSYVVPLDADLSNPNAVQSLISVASIQTAMGGAANRLMVFDSCRNNPADGWRQLEAQRGAAVNAVFQRAGNPLPNTLTLFSTAPGRTALDGPAGENSPFAAAFLRQLDVQSVDFQALPARLRRDLLIATEGKQVVWDNSTYQQSFLLSGPAVKNAGSRSSWSGDPSRIVELHNAYAYAQEKGLSLPAGLISHRPDRNSRHGLKIGCFKYSYPGPARDLTNQILVVMSVEENQIAEVIIAGDRGRTMIPFWQFITARLNGDNLEYVPNPGAARFIFSWKDAGSGSLTLLWENGGGPDRGKSSYNTLITRLDG